MKDNRYIKNILIDGFGETGQKKLLDSKVAVIGIGGLGSAVSLYLAAAGVGELIVVDYDKVELKNLQRQILYNEEVLDMSKPETALQRLSKLNSKIKVNIYKSRWEDVKDLLIEESIDIMVDCVDNINIKFALNDFAVINRIPMIHAGVVAMQGQITTIVPGRTGCLRCLFGDSVPENTSSDDFGILGAVAGNMGTLQAIEVIKYLSGAGDYLGNKVLFIDYRKNKYKTVKFQKADGCICGGNNG